MTHGFTLYLTFFTKLFDLTFFNLKVLKDNSISTNNEKD